MCTSLTLTTNAFYFGRNLDLEYDFGQRVVITPRNYPFRFQKAGILPNHYAMIGMATVHAVNPDSDDMQERAGYPLYAEAANEKGLCIAGLNFPDNAYYPPEEATGKENVSPFELIPWLLGKCANLKEARESLSGMHLISIPFSDQIPLSPLHWHIADKTGSIVLESTQEGMKIHENPVGVMTNNPPFDFHMTNLRQYLNLTPDYPENRFSKQMEIKPFGVGFGSIGLPGDFSPTSRFIKAVFLKLNSVCDGSERGSISQFFHLLDAVVMPDGIVATPNGKFEKTDYSCCINADEGIYYYKTYSNHQITAVRLNNADLEGNGLTEYPLATEQQIAWQN